MKTRPLFIGVLLVVSILAAGLAVNSTLAAEPIPTWEQVNQDGFGEPVNFNITSMEAFDDYLYAGTVAPTGIFPNIFYRGQIWRSADGGEWELVRETLDFAIGDFIEFGDYLYAGYWNGKIARSTNGLDWEEVVTDGFGHAGTEGFNGQGGGFYRFEVYKDALYVSSQLQLTGTEIWRTTDGLTWEQMVDAGLTHPGNWIANASAVYKGYLYWGTTNYLTMQAELWRSDGVTTEAVEGAFFGTGNCGLTALAEFKGYLYARVFGVLGGSVWRTANGIDWTQIESISRPGDFGSNALIVYQDQLYLVAQNISTATWSNLGTTVYRTSNGFDWEQIGFDGFGDLNNDGGGGALFKGDLYVGTGNFATGGEIWRLCKGICK